MPPSARGGRPIPPELEQLILECLAKDPAQRPGSARELRERLRAIPLDDPWTPQRAEAWWSRHQPGKTSQRPIADVVLSQEARPARVLRPARG